MNSASASTILAPHAARAPLSIHDNQPLPRRALSSCPRPARTLLCGAVLLALTGCANLLPTSDTATERPWGSFEEAMHVYDRIEPSKTTVDDLKAMGIDPFAGENITILNYADLIRRFAPPGASSLAALDPTLRRCIEAMQACRGYEIDQRHSHKDHTGNFWLDFLNFRRTVRTTGWQFTATLVLNDTLVVHKVWSGQPATHAVEDQRNPLGPAQGLGLSNLPFLR